MLILNHLTYDPLKRALYVLTLGLLSMALDKVKL